eukprot:CAMPEP_0184686418 /NCGR_PEP_ID=MMETSP0312-20130426/22374_1 /TAXON_ID=31354 /ORGANISM="Compsopogon coeruleus, Strain SAG 36.94" /LENGTH=111 /DNA_ID=CAMNT_0027141477 /DNA_START=111 /DNA_END=446 /DNA_ORIENTATION=+
MYASVSADGWTTFGEFPSEVASKKYSSSRETGTDLKFQLDTTVRKRELSSHRRERFNSDARVFALKWGFPASDKEERSGNPLTREYIAWGRSPFVGPGTTRRESNDFQVEI